MDQKEYISLSPAVRAMVDQEWKGMVDVIAPQPDNRRGHPRFYQLLEELADLHIRKSDGYGSDKDSLANLRGVAEVGIDPLRYCLGRIQEKWHRTKRLINGAPDTIGEPMAAELMDIAGCSLLAIILLEEEAADGNSSMANPGPQSPDGTN